MREQHKGKLEQQNLATAADASQRWRSFHERFQELSNEERANTSMEPLCAYGSDNADRLENNARVAMVLYCNTDHPAVIPLTKGKSEYGYWVVNGRKQNFQEGSLSEIFRERYLALAFEAGRALGCSNSLCVEFWLHRLAKDLARSKSKLIVYPNKRAGALILRLCEASAVFCLRLVRSAAPEIALESDLRQAQNKERGPTERERAIYAVIQRGSKGRLYCRELDGANIAPPRSGVWKGGRRTYLQGYDEGGPWRHRVEVEKSRVRRKVKLWNSQNSQ